MKMYKGINRFSDFILNETLKTHDINLTKRNVEYELSLLRYDFSIETENNKVSISLYNVSKTQIFELLLNNLNNLMIDRHGWFPSTMYMVNIHDMSNLMKYDEEYILSNYIHLKTIRITYESKYDVEVNIPKKLYHLSIEEFADKILKFGLVPKSKNKLSKHLDRIYVCETPQDCKFLINRMLIHYNAKYGDKINKNWIVFEIDTTDLDIKLYIDPNYKGGYYVVDNIPPNKISLSEQQT